MYVATANLQSKMSQDDRYREALIVFNQLADPYDTIVCWQEIRVSPEMDRHIPILAAEPNNTRHCFRDLPIPVSVPTGRYEVLEEYWYQTLEPSTVGPDNARYMGVLKLRAKFRETADKFYLINTHFPAGCNWDNPTPTVEEQDSRDRWAIHFEAAKAEIARIKDPTTVNKTVFWVGDCNRGAGMPQFFPAEKQAFGQSSVDKAYVIDRNIATSETGQGVINLQVSDHDCKWAQWRLTAA